MGHLSRSTQFAKFLEKQSEQVIFFINEYSPAINYLRDKNFSYVIIPTINSTENWEKEYIQEYGIKIWVNDYLDTSSIQAQNIKSEGIKLVTFDDQGAGAALSDIHVAGLLFDQKVKLQGKKILNGFEYIVLNENIADYRRERTEINRIIVSMGGTDTYGVTIKVVELLRNLKNKITIVTGPGFQHMEELQNVIPQHFVLKENVPSLIREFSGYDLAVTGGGITPFEACAAGLPCIVIANEPFEIPVGKQLEHKGLCLFAGHHEAIRKETFNLSIDIQEMSKKGMQMLDVNAGKRIYNEIKML